MLVAITGDTHLPRGSRRLPDALVERIRGADLLIHTGDFVSGEALEEIEALGPPLQAVHGNIDRPEVFERLPDMLQFELEGHRIGVIHDPGPERGRMERLRDRFPDCEAVVFGHTHTPQHESDAGFQIFNPGSPTETRGRWPSHTMGVLEADGRALRFELIELD